MPKTIISHTFPTGLTIEFMVDGRVLLEGDETDFILQGREIPGLLAQLMRWGFRPDRAEIAGEQVPVLDGIVFNGPTGPVMLVDMAEQLKAAGIRNAELVQDLAAREAEIAQLRRNIPRRQQNGHSS